MKCEIISNVTTREKLINRVEVLDKVKKLLLIPRMQFTTTQGVADFYEVEYKAIDSVMRRHKDELTSDGMTKVTRKSVIECFRQNDEYDKTILNIQPQYIELKIDDNYSVNIANRGALIFPKRAILRIGMLLRDSKIAEEVRTQLLNIEENSSDEVKVKEIDTELNLLGQALTSAFIDNDIEAFANASMKLNQYTNRHKDATIKALRSEVKELNTSLNRAMFELNEMKALNSVLSANLSQVTSSEVCRRAVISMMKRLTIKRNFRSEWLCWKEFYILLRDKYGINISSRKYSEVIAKDDIPMIDYITDEEWPEVLSIATALCHRFDVEISDLLLNLKRNEVA